jgi:hypothetical protein
MKRRTTKKIKKRNLFHGGNNKPNKIYPKMPSFQMMILPCSYYKNDCDNDENVAITIDKDLLNEFKLNDKGIATAILKKNGLFIVEPDKIPDYEKGDKILSPYYKHIINNLEEFTVDDPAEYYMIITSKPYLHKLGKCVKKEMGTITFNNKVYDNNNKPIVDVETEVNTADIENNKQMIIKSSDIKYFAFMLDNNLTSAEALELIRNISYYSNQHKGYLRKARRFTRSLRNKISEYAKSLRSPEQELPGTSNLTNINHTSSSSTNSSPKNNSNGTTTGESSVSSSSSFDSNHLKKYTSLPEKIKTNADLLVSRSLPGPIQNNTKLLRSSSLNKIL